MKASNIFQKLKSAGVGNPDGISAKKPVIKAVGIKSPLNMGKKSPMEMGNKSPMEMGKKSPMEMGHKSPTKMGKKSPMKKGGSSKKSDPYADALKKDPKLGEYVKIRNSAKKGTKAYVDAQNKINSAYGVSKRHSVTVKDEGSSNTPPPANNTNKEKEGSSTNQENSGADTGTKKQTGAEKLTAAKGAIKDAKAAKKAARIEKRAARKSARQEKRAARKQKRADKILAKAESISPKDEEQNASAAQMKKSPMKMAKAGKKDPVKPAPKAGKKDPVKPAPKAGKKDPVKPAAKAGKKSPTKFNAGLKKAAADGKLDNNPKFKAAVEKSPAKLKGKPSIGKKVKFGKGKVSEKRAARLIKKGKASMSYAIGGIGPDNQPGGKNNKGQLKINKKKSIKIKKIKR